MFMLFVACRSDMEPAASGPAESTNDLTVSPDPADATDLPMAVDTASPLDTGSGGCEGIIVFPDPHLVDALSEEPELRPDFDGTATHAELLRVTKIDEDSDEQGIVDLTGLECLWNVEVIHFDENRIANIEPLRSLTKLRELSLNENLTLSDLSALSDLPNLESLDLSDNAITDVGALVANPGIGAGDRVYLYDNELDCAGQAANLAALLERGVDVHHNCGQSGVP